jgi:hypothetical protein
MTLAASPSRPGALELLGMSVARSVLADAQIRLPQPYSAFIGQTI